mgnify:CR=1 FL=1
MKKGVIHVIIQVILTEVDLLMWYVALFMILLQLSRNV